MNYLAIKTPVKIYEYRQNDLYLCFVMANKNKNKEKYLIPGTTYRNKSLPYNSYLTKKDLEDDIKYRNSVFGYG